MIAAGGCDTVLVRVFSLLLLVPLLSETLPAPAFVPATGRRAEAAVMTTEALAPAVAAVHNQRLSDDNPSIGSFVVSETRRLLADTRGEFGRMDQGDDALRQELGRLARPVGDDSNPEIYRRLLTHLGIRGGHAADIGAGRNRRPALALRAAGIEKVWLVNRFMMKQERKDPLPEGLSDVDADALSLTIADHRLKVVIFNESLDFLLVYREATGASDIEGLTLGEARVKLYSGALAEARRVLAPEGLIAIKLGNAMHEVRDEEAPIVTSALERLGFEDISVARSGELPTFIWARVPAQDAVPPQTGSAGKTRAFKSAA